MLPMDERGNRGPANAASDLPEPPWRMSRSKPSRTRLTRAAIVDAALEVLDAVGMEGLSMRRVGQALGTGAGSLYWHVRNKEELFQLIFERVIETSELPEPDPSRWKEQLKQLAVQMRQVLNRHRDVARLSLGRVPSSSVVAVYTEWTFNLLKPVGIPDAVIAYLGDLFGLYVGAFAFEESLGLASPTGEDLPPEQIVAMIRDYVLSLPQERFPHTRAAVDLIFSGGEEQRFNFAIDLIIRGIETYARRPPTAADG
jgi:TetR/AcrR family transcriptional regulator, tetracycline repressor protein